MIGDIARNRLVALCLDAQGDSCLNFFVGHPIHLTSSIKSSAPCWRIILPCCSHSSLIGYWLLTRSRKKPLLLVEERWFSTLLPLFPLRPKCRLPGLLLRLLLFLFQPADLCYLHMLFLRHGRGFQGELTQSAATVFADQQGGGAVEVHVAAAAQAAALFADGFQEGHAFFGQVVAFEALFHLLRVGLHEVFGGEQGHVVFLHGGGLDGTGQGQAVAAVTVFDFRPEDAGGIDEDQAAAQFDALLTLGHRRFVAGPGYLAAGQGVDEGGFAHVGNAGDQGGDGGGPVPFFVDHLLANIGQFAHRFRLVGGDGQGADGGVFLQVLEPLLGDDRVGQVAFAEQFQTGLVGTEILDHRVGAAVGQAGVDDFDDQIHLGQDLADLAGGLVHVAGEPVDAHKRVLPVCIEYQRIIADLLRRGVDRNRFALSHDGADF